MIGCPTSQSHSKGEFMQGVQWYFGKLGLVVSLVALVLASSNPAFAQSSNGAVRGTVRDQTSSVIPGAKLALTNKATNTALRTETNEAGLYVFPSVIPGEYNLTVMFTGMETLQVELVVHVQVSTTFNAVLKPGSTETKITVSAEARQLVVDSPTLGHVLERQRIEQLPLNGRDIQQLLVTVPGLDVATANQVRSWGMMAGAHNYFLDGAELEAPMWVIATVHSPPGHAHTPTY